MVNPHTGRVHTSYAQAVAVAGRLAATDPNLHNIPIRTADAGRIREAFIAPPDYVQVSAEYLQLELRIMPHISQDAGLPRALDNLAYCDGKRGSSRPRNCAIGDSRPISRWK